MVRNCGKTKVNLKACVCVNACVCVKYKKTKESSRNRYVRASKMKLTGTALLFKMLLVAGTICHDSGKTPVTCCLTHRCPERS